jgi:hypothetical protein
MRKTNQGPDLKYLASLEDLKKTIKNRNEISRSPGADLNVIFRIRSKITNSSAETFVDGVTNNSVLQNSVQELFTFKRKGLIFQVQYVVRD